MSGLTKHVLGRLRRLGEVVAWQALMIATGFIGYCVASALIGRMVQMTWFVGVYLGTGFLIQAGREFALYRRSTGRSN